ncbi:MAG: hypothetical protein AAF586_03645, partial [Planctomycetota bacterium]
LADESGIRSSTRTLRPLLRDCAAGFYQEMFFLGQDVIHSHGNQLVEYGFVRTPSKGMTGTSCYTLDSESHTIELYGSCACCYCESARVAFIRTRSRFYDWLPEERCVAGLWTEHDLDEGQPEAMLHRVRPLLHWWLEYERWIARRLGDAYRDLCFEEWRKVNKRKSWLPPREATRWVEQFLANGSSQVRPKSFKSSRRRVDAG